METAINIGFACSLLRQGMKQVPINVDSPNIKTLEKIGDKDVIAKVSQARVLKQITQRKDQLAASNAQSEATALIIDGKSLVYALEDDTECSFLELAIGCSSVVYCRSSPKQKALVTRLVKNGTGRTTLAIGDRANDVGMLHEAEIGVGISGAAGMQAVMSSDISIAQFWLVERLLLVHGHWCCRRISSMICYFFYKNITFAVSVFLYVAYTSSSAEPASLDWFLSLYSVLFTSFPVLYAQHDSVSSSLCSTMSASRMSFSAGFGYSAECSTAFIGRLTVSTLYSHFPSFNFEDKESYNSYRGNEFSCSAPLL
ncbi:hypothetical protein Nepgr_024390 [Nepenthes gracilis]|uniref:P-type phospholipid transporter n=1 Tax=Nepenthes gracilis TaxID=150966 RepID=A0AAD3T5W2_NEPGR|nr:hypothetical protein Nepgr_024390 [Nepenthes gracilis]